MNILPVNYILYLKILLKNKNIWNLLKKKVLKKLKPILKIKKLNLLNHKFLILN